MKKLVIVILTLATLGAFASPVNNSCNGKSGQYKQYFLACDVSADVVKTYAEMFAGVADSSIITGAENAADVLYNMRLEFFMDDLAMRCSEKDESVSCEAYNGMAGVLKENGIPNES